MKMTKIDIDICRQSTWKTQAQMGG